MPFDKEVRLLSMADVLAPLSEDEVEELARNHRDIRLKRGDILFSPGDYGEQIFILKEGRIQIHRTDSRGQEITLALVEKGMMFGEMALTAPRTRVTYARAVEPSIALSLSREDLKDLIVREPRVGLRIIEWLSERVRQLEIRLEDLSSKEAPARLASLILQLVESEGVVIREGYAIPNRYTHDQLGAMIGANRVTVTRAMAELRECGAIEPSGRRIRVKDIEALGRAAKAEQRAKRIADFRDKSG